MRRWARILERAGAQVVTATNGQTAIDLALRSVDDAAPFDLILMDMQMPIMDGREAVRQLRQHGCTGPIMALTAHAMEPLLAGRCDGYETKPVRADRLVAACESYLLRSTRR